MEESRIASVEGKSDEDCPSLLQLNDDCLMAVFKYLHYKDLNAIKRCSKRLQQTVNQHLTNRFATRLIYINKIPSTMLERFGSHIQTIRIRGPLGVDEVKHLRRLCPNLKKLTVIKGFTADAFSVPELGDIFSGLTEMRITGSGDIPPESDSIKKTMQRCEKLKTLSLTGYSPYPYGDMFSVEYPQLRKLSLYICREYPGPELITEFFQRHQQIRFLDLTSSNEPFDWSVIFELKNLETLRVHDYFYGIGEEDLFTPFIEQISKLPMLTKLILMSPFREMPNFSSTKHLNSVEITVAGMKPIDRDVLKCFAAMPNLTKLQLYPLTISDRLKWCDVVDFVKTPSSSLKELKISYIRCKKSDFDETHALISELYARESVAAKFQVDVPRGEFHPYFTFYLSPRHNAEFLQALSDRI